MANLIKIKNINLSVSSTISNRGELIYSSDEGVLRISDDSSVKGFVTVSGAGFLKKPLLTISILKKPLLTVSSDTTFLTLSKI